MASFIEFLKSGKSAREFIDQAVLPQHPIPVSRTNASPAPYEKDDEAVDVNGEEFYGSEDALTGVFDPENEIATQDGAVEIMDANVGLEIPHSFAEEDEPPDEDFMKQLESLEDGEGQDDIS